MSGWALCWNRKRFYMLKSRSAAGAIVGLLAAIGMGLMGSTAHALTPSNPRISITKPSNLHQIAYRVMRPGHRVWVYRRGYVRAIGFGALGSGTITEGGGTLVPGGVMDQDGVLVGDGVQGSTSVSAAEA